MKNKKFIFPIIILGLSFVLAIAFVRPIGVSTEYSVVSGIVQKFIDPDVVTEKQHKIQTTNEYYAKDDDKVAKLIEHPMNYGVLFVCSIPFGALLASIVVKKRKLKGEKSKINPSWVSSPIVLFIGGFLLLFGARWANGCTSGHMMSGIMQSSVSGLVFAAIVFVVAILTALIVYNKRGGKK